MNLLFSDLFNQIYPFYFLIFFGYILGRYFEVDNKSTVNILFYLIVPVVFFEFGTKLDIDFDYLLLPIVLFGMNIVLNRIFLMIGEKTWPSSSKASVIAFSAGTSNTGYFGLPVAIMLFDDHTVAVYMLMNIGLSFYDYTLGAFTIARANFSRSQALISVLKLPILYAFIIGIIISKMGFVIPNGMTSFFEYFRGTYVLLGMILLGLGLSGMKKFKLDIKFTSVMLASRFIAAPVLTLALIYLDMHYTQLFARDIHLAALLTSIVPPAANTVVFAAMHNAHPEEAAVAVLVGTILGIFYLPLMVALIF